MSRKILDGFEVGQIPRGGMIMMGAGDNVYNYYVDIDNGNDATGDGTLAAPWKTLVKAETVVAASKTIGVKGNGVSRETAAVTMKAGQLVAAMSGHHPIISRATLRTGFTLTEGKTKTYEIATTDAVSSTTQDAVTALTSRASVDLVEANPGSFFKDGAANKLYVSCTDSADPSTHVIESCVAQTGLTTAGCIVFGGNGCEIRGLILQHGTDTNIGALSSTGGIVRNCTSRYSYSGNGFGLKIKAAGSVTSINTTYDHCKTGWQNFSGTLISQNDTISYSLTAVWSLSTPVAVLVSDFTTHHNTGSGIGSIGSVLSGVITSYNNTVSGIPCPVGASFTPVSYNNGIGVNGVGVAMLSADGVTVTSVDIHDNNSVGVQSTSVDTIISGGSIKDNASVGISSNAAGLHVTGVEVSGNSGIQIGASGDEAEIDHIVAVGVAGKTNIYVYGSDSPVVHDNLSSDAGVIGIYLLGCTTPVVYDNECFDNGSYGLEVEACTSPVVYGNVTHGNTALGIVCKTAVTGADFHDNLSHDDPIAWTIKGNPDGAEFTDNESRDCATGIHLNKEPGTPDVNNANIHILRHKFTRCALGYNFADANQATGLTSDYNTFVGCTDIGRWGNGVTYHTLAEWQAATGLDAHSTAS